MIRFAPLALSLLATTATAQEGARVAIVSAFEPEWTALVGAVDGAGETAINGTRFVTGTLEGQEVVLFLSGISMVNAAMNVQLALERFDIDAIVFSGIAGGVDPELNIGDVVVAEQWGQYLDVIAGRATEDGYAIPPWMSSDFTPFGMFHTRNQTVLREGLTEPERRFWFPVDPDLLALAGSLDAPLEDCAAGGACLEQPPQLVVGGNGVSGAAFVDNAELRIWADEVFDAKVLDMESAAVAQVAWSNGVPFIAFRSLSDLAGGGPGANEMNTFLGIAAQNSAGVVRAFLAAME